MQFEALTQIALLGTERQSLPSSPADSPLGQLLARIDVNQREQALLKAAALVAQYERAGNLPVKTGQADVPPCSPESLPWVGARAGGHLLTMLGGEKDELLPEWFALCKQSQQLAPPEALPMLLSLGKAKADLREPILTVLGERGRWLATQLSEWSWVAGETQDESIWQTGEPAARLMFLRKLRQSDPAKARELLAAVWEQEQPDERSAFVQALSVNLGPEDEAFLESALDDKRKEVRRRSADLLIRLPESALVKRMQERLLPLLKFTPGEAGSILKLKKGTKAALEITLPTECNKAMQRDGIDVKPPQGIGEKAWWLVQMLKAVPLKFLEQTCAASPEQIVEGALQTEWRKQLIEAWCESAIRQEDLAWCRVLVEQALKDARIDDWSRLLLVLPQAERDQRVETLFTEQNLRDRIYRVLDLFMEHGSEGWSANFSRRVIAWLKQESAKAAAEPGMWGFLQRLPQGSRHLAPEVLGEAADGWPTQTEGWQYWNNSVDKFLAVVHFRQEMRKGIIGQD